VDTECAGELQKMRSTHAIVTKSGMEMITARSRPRPNALTTVIITEIARTEYAHATMGGKGMTARKKYPNRQSVRRDPKGSNVAVKVRAQKESVNAILTTMEMPAKFRTVRRAAETKFAAEEENATGRENATV